MLRGGTILSCTDGVLPRTRSRNLHRNKLVQLRSGVQSASHWHICTRPFHEYAACLVAALDPHLCPTTSYPVLSSVKDPDIRTILLVTPAPSRAVESLDTQRLRLYSPRAHSYHGQLRFRPARSILATHTASPMAVASQGRRHHTRGA